MKRIIYPLILAAGVAGIALQAWAQGPGHGRGMHDPVEMLQRLQAKLNLNTSQQQQFDAAVAQSKAAHQAMRANFSQIKTAMQTELAKSDPDLVGAGWRFRSGAGAEHGAAQTGPRRVACALCHVQHGPENDRARCDQRADRTHASVSPAHAGQRTRHDHAQHERAQRPVNARRFRPLSSAGPPDRRLKPNPFGLGVGFFLVFVRRMFALGRDPGSGRRTAVAAWRRSGIMLLS